VKIVADWTVYGLARLFFFLLRVLPRAIGYRLCSGLADLVYLLDVRHRRIGMANLRWAFPGKDEAWRRRVLRRSFRRQGDQAVELSRLPGISAEQLAERVGYEEGRGLENYQEARALGRGVLFVTAHISAWELLPAAHAAQAHPLSFVVRPLDNRRFDLWLQTLRSRFGNRVISKSAAIRRSLKILKEGRDVGFLIDQNIQAKEGVFVPLFGRLACTTTSVAALALRTSAPVIPGFIYPAQKRGYYRIRFYPPVEVVSSGNPEADITRYTALFNCYLEEVIREFPDCWLWGHRRFRTQPDDSDPYSEAS
jgi:Kdo2-lipid IVA lauroyltransferase/acyltransferase